MINTTGRQAQWVRAKYTNKKLRKVWSVECLDSRLWSQSLEDSGESLTPDSCVRWGWGPEMSNWSSGICQKHPQIRFSAFLWQRLVWFQFWGWFRKFKKINWSSRPTLSLHCRFSCAVSHLSGTIHTVDQMCPDLFTLWGWNVHFRHFNREQEEYRTGKKKSYENFWTKGKLKRLRQRWRIDLCFFSTVFSVPVHM